MKTSFIIYIKAVGIYALITLPTLFFPPMYIISMYFVLIYGWFAWGLFTILYLVFNKLVSGRELRKILLTISIPAAVAFSFQMLEEFEVYEKVWHSGSFLLFPLAATVSGWISLFAAAKRIQYSAAEQLQPVTDETSLVNKQV